MRYLTRITLALLATVTVSGCDASRTVAGQPVGPVRIPTIASTSTPGTPPSIPTATTTSTVPPPEVEQPGTEPPPESTAPASDPTAAVQAYFDAINARDYQRAWDLGGKNVGGQTYESFVAGFATTDHDVLTIQSVQGNTVTADLVAVQADGTQRTFHGTYTVTDGVLTQFSVRATG